MRPLQVLVLCTGNSARSILLEVMLNTRSGGRLRAHSAGSDPAGRVHPGALALLRQQGLPTDGLASKSWDRFSAPDAPSMDMVITVCGNAEQKCPVWPGAPLRAHWGLPDPASDDPARWQADFTATWQALEQRVAALLDLPFETMPTGELTQALARIGAGADRAAG